MTQIIHKAQEFNALQFELQHAQDFEPPAPIYEHDSFIDFGQTMYRIWVGINLIGTYYEVDGKWRSHAFYKNRQYLRLDQDLEKTFDSIAEAESHIKDSYLG